MTFTTQQIKSAYKNLTGEVKDLIGSNETTEFISTNLVEAGLSGEQADMADSEILYAMYGLQSLDSAINNIAKINSKKPGELTDLTAKLQYKIFSKIKFDKPIEESSVEKSDDQVIITQDNKEEALEHLDKMVAENKQTQAQDLGQSSISNLPQMIHNSLPMIEPGEVVHDVPHVEIEAPEIKAPQTPTPPITPAPAPVVAPAPAPATKKVVPPAPSSNRYPEGFDPYREPIV